MSPDGTLMVTDGMSKNVGGKGNEWGIQVADLNGGRWDHVNDGPFARLMVAERRQSAP
ncbi:MAG: hypothetical protein IAE77_03095 [Prosthecobacter sp.]|nr:hypothetical protein [Prosthecobacter sp.]